MAVYSRGKKGIYYYEFWFAGKRVRGSTGTTRKTLAVEFEKSRHKDLERAHAGLPVQQPKLKIRSVKDCTTKYLKDFVGKPKTRQWIRERLPHVEEHLGRVLLPDLTEDRIRWYMKTRAEEIGNQGRTVNMEVALLSRAIGNKWSILWPKVKPFVENEDVGIALTSEQESALLIAVDRIRSYDFDTYVRLLLLTAMRPDREALNMQWKHVDFDNELLTVAKSKTKAGEGRVLPMNAELLAVLRGHADRHKLRYGSLHPDHYLFPRRKPAPADPLARIGSFKKAWGQACKEAKIEARVYDCRHTMLTKLAESGASDSTIMAIAGHLSRRMLERYSHIRMKAKREAMVTVVLPKGTLDSIHTATRMGSPSKVPTGGNVASSRSPQVTAIAASGA